MPQSNQKIINRDEPLSKVRVASVFAGAQRPNELLDQTGEHFHPFDKDKEVSCGTMLTLPFPDIRGSASIPLTFVHIKY